MSSEPTMSEIAQMYERGEITTGQYMAARDADACNGPNSVWARGSGLHSGGGEGCGGAGVGANAG